MKAKEYLIYRNLIYKSNRGSYKLNMLKEPKSLCEEIIKAMEDYAEIRVNRSLDEMVDDIDAQQNIEQI